MENQAFCWDLLMMYSMKASYQLLVLTLKSELFNPQEVSSSFKYGTLLVKKSSKLSQPLITKVLKDFYSSSIFQTESHSLTLKIGCSKPRNIHTRQSSKYLLETNLINKPREKFQKSKLWDSPLQWECNILRHQLKTPRM